MNGALLILVPTTDGCGLVHAFHLSCQSISDCLFHQRFSIAWYDTYSEWHIAFCLCYMRLLVLFFAYCFLWWLSSSVVPSFVHLHLSYQFALHWVSYFSSWLFFSSSVVVYASKLFAHAPHVQMLVHFVINGHQCLVPMTVHYLFLVALPVTLLDMIELRVYIDLLRQSVQHWRQGFSTLQVGGMEYPSYKIHQGGGVRWLWGKERSECLCMNRENNFSSSKR